jgi:hypothetical protein
MSITYPSVHMTVSFRHKIPQFISFLSGICSLATITSLQPQTPKPFTNWLSFFPLSSPYFPFVSVTPHYPLNFPHSLSSLSCLKLFRSLCGQPAFDHLPLFLFKIPFSISSPRALFQLDSIE